MKIDEIWLIQYADDDTFLERLNAVQKTMTDNKILSGDGYMELCKEQNIPCARKADLVADETRVVKDYFKVPFVKL